MTVDRRTFMAGAACVAVTPVTRLVPSAFAAPELNVLEPPVFKISGWSAADALVTDNELWMRVGFGWKTAWR